MIGGIGREVRSGYSRSAVPGESYFGQPVTGTIGQHLPKEVIRVERDWTGGEVCQWVDIHTHLFSHCSVGTGSRLLSLWSWKIGYVQGSGYKSRLAS